MTETGDKDDRAQRAKDLLRQADEMSEAGRHEMAVKLCRDALRADPGAIGARLCLGIALEKSGRHAAAELEFRRFLLHCEGKTLATVNHLGHVLMNKGLPGRAAAFFSISTRGKPRAHRLVMYGVALRDIGLWTEAVEAMERAIAVDPAYDDAHHNLGAFLMGADPDRARECFLRALEIDPARASTYSCLCRLAHTDGKFEEAEELARKGLDADPRSDACCCGLGLALDAMGRTAEAEDALRRAADLSDDAFWSRSQLAQFFWRNSRYAEAKAEFEGILRAWPDEEESYIDYAKFLEDALADHAAAGRIRDRLEEVSKLLSRARHTATPGP